MADALISAPVAVVTGAVAVGLILAASRKVGRDSREGIVSLMGVLGAFVFAAQMINFTIPGTGSSGHIIGGILLSAMLGPWSAFLTLCSVLIVQCLLFADGGLMALGCNIINMAAMSCLVAYPLVFRPIVKGRVSPGRLMTASVAACLVGLELGALAVSLETVCSGITALPFFDFLGVMLSIHCVIGILEGVATGLVLLFVYRNSPALIRLDGSRPNPKARRRVLIALLAVAVVFAVGFTWIASAYPDGLEWSIARIAGTESLGEDYIPPTAVIPDYDSHFAGIIGGVLVMAVVWSVCAVCFRNRKKHAKA